MALSAASGIAIPELDMAFKEEVQEEVVEEKPIALWNPHLVGQRCSWSSTALEMADVVGVE